MYCSILFIICILVIQGVEMTKESGLILMSDVIRQNLNIECAVLMGANLANEVSQELYCESTIGCSHQERGAEIKAMLQVSCI